MKKQSKASASVRLLRVGEAIRHALSDILKRDSVHDPDLYGKSITVTEADVSPDLKNANIYILPLGGANGETIVTALNRASAFLRGQLGKTVHMKYIPKLKFALDNSFDEAGRMNVIFSDPKVRQDLIKQALIKDENES